MIDNRLIIIDKTYVIEGENGNYEVSSKYGIKLNLPENVMEFRDMKGLINFFNEVKEVFEMVSI